MSQALATKQGPTKRKPELKVVKPKTLNDVLHEGRNKPSPFSQWNLMVERNVDDAMGKPGVPKDRKEARDHVLAQDRSYWM